VLCSWLSLYSRQAGVSGFWCHLLDRAQDGERWKRTVETATLQDGDGDALGDDGDGLERPASPRRICAVTRRFQTTNQDLSVFPFLYQDTII